MSDRWPWSLRYLTVVVLLIVVLAARRLDLVTNPQFWAEDGFLYFHDQVVFGFFASLPKFYAGFPHLGQRLVALCGALGPLAAAPRVYATLTVVLTASGLASFILPAFRHVVRSDALRLTWCVGAACLPLEHGMPPVLSGGELGTPANLGWWLSLWLMLVSLMRLPAQRWRVVLLALAGTVVIFSTPLAPVFAPFWMARLWIGLRQGHPRDVAFASTLLVALGACTLVTRGLGANVSNAAAVAHGSFALSFFDDPAGYLTWYATLLPDRIAALILAPSILMAVRDVGPWVSLPFAAVIVVGLTAATRTRWALVAALYVFAAALLLTTLGRLFWANQPIENFPPRYTLLPAAAFLLAIVIALDGLPSGLLRRATIGTTVAILASSFAPRFLLPKFRDQRWPVHAQILQQRLQSASPEPLTIPMNPPYSPLRFDARELADDHR